MKDSERSFICKNHETNLPSEHDEENLKQSANNEWENRVDCGDYWLVKDRNGAFWIAIVEYSWSAALVWERKIMRLGWGVERLYCDLGIQ